MWANKVKKVVSLEFDLMYKLHNGTIVRVIVIEGVGDGAVGTGVVGIVFVGRQPSVDVGVLQRAVVSVWIIFQARPSRTLWYKGYITAQIAGKIQRENWGGKVSGAAIQAVMAAAMVQQQWSR